MSHTASFARVYPILDNLDEDEETSNNTAASACTYAPTVFTGGMNSSRNYASHITSGYASNLQQNHGMNIAGFIIKNPYDCAPKLQGNDTQTHVSFTNLNGSSSFISASTSTYNKQTTRTSSTCTYKVDKIVHLIPTLSPEQQATIIVVMKGKNVFFSGAGGTGKSHLLRVLFLLLPEQTTFFTASSGLAAVNIEGTTLHSFAGIGRGEGSADELAAHIRANKFALQRWLSCRVLVCDEISMVGGELFDKLERIARIVRNSTDCFGGIQLVLSGDFLQLAPVRDPLQTFQAHAWSRCIHVSIILTTVFRQLHDAEFITFLTNLRRGTLTPSDVRILKSSADNNLCKQSENGVVPTKIHGKRVGVHLDNESMLKSLRGRSVYFDAHDRGSSDKHMEALKQDCPAKTRIELRVGAQVILLKNMHRAIGLCKGTRGIVTEFVRSDDTSLEEITSLMSASSITAAAASTAKYHTKHTQPGTCVSDMHVPHASSLDELGGFTVANPKDKLLPRVMFENGKSMLVEYDVFSTRLQGEIVASRKQIPLELAWALSAHAVQGMTLKSAVVNAEDMFAYGQLYVATSRVPSLQHLQVKNFVPSCLKTNFRIVRWYDALEETTKKVVDELLAEKDQYL